MDFSFLDSILDSVFVVNRGLEVQYCNEPAAKLCDSSVRRLQGKSLGKFLNFPNLPWYGEGKEPQAMALAEVDFHNLKTAKQGKVQVSVSKQEGTDPVWLILIRDVTLEEVLHQKYHLQLEEKQVVIDQLKVAQAELENYSKNLERMVEERTEEVRAANVMLNAIMDSLGQGFLVFDKNGQCADFYTKACLHVLGKVPKDNKIWDVLGLKDKDADTFRLWIQAVFSKSLPFDSLKPLAVGEISPKSGQYVNLDYFQIEDSKPENGKLVLVATDVTAERVAKDNLEKEKLFAKMILKIVGNRRQFSKFLDSTRENIRQVGHVVRQGQIDLESVLRQLHTLEGEAALFSVREVWKASRPPQEILQTVRDSSSITIESVLPNLTTAVQGLETAFKNYYSQHQQLFTSLGIGRGETFEFTRPAIDQIIKDLRGYGMTAEALKQIEHRMLSKPLSELLSHYDEAVSSLAERLNKKVKPVVWEGTDRLVRPEHYSDLLASLVHSFRNMLDHGVEPAEDRLMLGKSEFATIKFKAGVANSMLTLQLSDDGQGVDLERLKKKLQEQGRDLTGWAEDAILQTIFEGGVSTRDTVTEFSGRGIGMNAIKDEAEKLGGSVRLHSEFGNGTTLTISVPWKESGDDELLKSA